jgi:adenylate cyclase
MAQCLAAGLPVGSSCSGRGACAQCLMTVLAGAEALSPAGPHEALVLARNQAATQQRLACQCRVMDSEIPVAVTTGYW